MTKRKSHLPWKHESQSLVPQNPVKLGWCQIWWQTSLVPAFGSLRWPVVPCEFKANLGYVMRPSHKKKMRGHIGLPIILSQFKEAEIRLPGENCLARLTEVTSIDYMETDIQHEPNGLHSNTHVQLYLKLYTLPYSCEHTCISRHTKNICVHKKPMKHWRSLSKCIYYFLPYGYNEMYSVNSDEVF